MTNYSWLTNKKSILSLKTLVNLQGVSIFPLIAIINSAFNCGDLSPEQTPAKDPLAKLDFLLSGTNKASPAITQYRDQVAEPIYERSYALREEMEDIQNLKVILDVLSHYNSKFCTNAVENLHYSLANITDMLEKFEGSSRAVAETLGFNPITRHDDFKRRYDMPESTKSLTKESIKDLDKYPADFRQHELMVLETKAKKLIDFLPSRGAAIRDKVESLVHALEKDLEKIQYGNPKRVLSTENSQVYALTKLGEQIIDSNHLPNMLLLCKKTTQPFQIVTGSPVEKGILS